jgi:predicted DNA-binding transcriptional regulator YafY
MPHIKNALFRYRIIDRALRNEYKPFPSKLKLRELCEEALFGSVTGDNICDSTIEKDLYAMRVEHDAPIKYSKKEGGYFYRDKSFSLDEVPLNATDIEAIQFAANILSQFRDVPVFKQFGSAIDKIVHRVSDELLNDSNDSVVEFEQAVSTRGSEYIPLIVKAIHNKNMLYFDYESFQTQERKARKVGPFLLKEYRNRWYMLCYDVVKQSVTNYALDRMVNLEESTEKFISPIDFDSKRFFKYATGVTASHLPPERIRFKADNVASRYIESQPFHASQRIIETFDDGSAVFELDVFVTEDFIRQLLSYSHELVVSSPQSLISELNQRAIKMVKNYS